VEIWFNPGCSKCRAAKAALDEAGLTYTIRRYLDDPPTAAELDDVLRRLGLEPWDIARMNEPEAAVLRELPKDRAAWIDAIVAHPRLIQRPIIIADDGTAVVARDQTTLQTALDHASR
jgi:arsenate reductase